MRRWMIRPAGPAARASSVAGRENAVMVKVTVPSACRSMTKASSPLSGCPGSVP